jgi:hypothetical protein
MPEYKNIDENTQARRCLVKKPVLFCKVVAEDKQESSYKRNPDHPSPEIVRHVGIHNVNIDIPAPVYGKTVLNRPVVLLNRLLAVLKPPEISSRFSKTVFSLERILTCFRQII